MDIILKKVSGSFNACLRTLRWVCVIVITVVDSSAPSADP